MNKLITICAFMVIFSEKTFATQKLSAEMAAPLFSTLQFQDIGRLTEFNRMLNAQHRLKISKLINKPENLIPQKYIGNDRVEIKDLLLKLKNVCPECGQVEGILTGEFYIGEYPEIIYDRQPVVNSNCAIPSWLKNKKVKLKSIVDGMGINIEDTDCDKEYISSLIDAL